MAIYYQLGQPVQEAGITGITIPVGWADLTNPNDPWTPFLSGSLIVAGFIDTNGVLQLDTKALDAQLAAQAASLATSRGGVTPLTVAPALAARIGKRTKAQ